MRLGRVGWTLLLLAGCSNLGDLTSGGSTEAGPADATSEPSAPADSSPDTIAADAPIPDSTVGDGGSDASADATISDADATTADSSAPDAPDGSFTVGGTVTGLPAGASVTLQDNGGNTLTVQGAASGSTTFAFTTAVASGGAYSVTVLMQPAGALCTVGAGKGTPSSASLSAVSVTCDVVVSVVAGEVFTCALLRGGGVDCWGDNANGELGNGLVGTSSSTPVQAAVTGAIAITAGAYHACALVQGIDAGEGTVSCWGEGLAGQLGIGTAPGSAGTPTPVTVLANPVRKLSAGGMHTCAVESTGAVYCWGDNASCDLGTGAAGASCSQEDSPVAVAAPVGDGGLTGVTAIAAGGSHTCALLGDGAVDCWGSNTNGQVGNGATNGAPVTVPTPVLSLSGVTAISAGGFHSCAIYSNADGGTLVNNLKCWGADANGQLGNGTAPPAIYVPTPIAVTGLSYSDVSCDDGTTCAITSTNALQCWGANTYGQLANGTPSGFVAVPTTVSTLSNVSAVGVGYSHACAVSGGGVECWGSDSSGQLGDGFVVEEPQPAPVQSLAPAGAIAAGGFHSCAIVADGGGAVCWGDNVNEDLGNNSPTRSSVPVPVANFTGGSAITLGAYHACALSGGRVFCWGDDDSGQLGNGSVVDQVATAILVPALDSVVAIAAGYIHTCALLMDGGVDCWGDDTYGQLGMSSDAGMLSSPTVVPGLGTVAAIATGSYHTCAALTDGGVYCWGSNSDGQLGSGSEGGNVTAPTRVAGLGDVAMMAAGSLHTCAALTDGGVYCWGNNTYGQLGTTPSTGSTTPVLVPGLAGVTALAAGNAFNCAKLSDGAVDCWGLNTYGQLGAADAGSTPSPIVGLGFAIAVGAGDYHACALLSDGAVDCWGLNAQGQLGIGMVLQPSPVPVQ